LKSRCNTPLLLKTLIIIHAYVVLGNGVLQYSLFFGVSATITRLGCCYIIILHNRVEKAMKLYSISLSMLDSLVKDIFSNVHSSSSANRVNKLSQTCSNVKGMCCWNPVGCRSSVENGIFY